MRSASGRSSATGLAIAGIADHVRAGWRGEIEAPVLDRYVALQVTESNSRETAEIVLELHDLQLLTLESQPHALKVRIFDPGRKADPHQAVLLAEFLHAEALLHVVGPGQQHRRARRQGIVERFDGDLLQVNVVKPQALAVPDDDLLVGSGVVP